MLGRGRVVWVFMEWYNEMGVVYVSGLIVKLGCVDVIGFVMIDILCG